MFVICREKSSWPVRWDIQWCPDDPRRPWLISWYFMYFGGVPSDRSYRKSYVIWVKQCHKPAMTGNGLSWFIHTTYKNIKLVMTGFIWFITDLPTLNHPNLYQPWVFSWMAWVRSRWCQGKRHRLTSAARQTGTSRVRSQPSRHVPTGGCWWHVEAQKYHRGGLQWTAIGLWPNFGKPFLC